MRLSRLAGVVVAALLLAGPAWAQEATSSTAQAKQAKQAQPKQPQQPESTAGGGALGVSFQNIRKRYAESTAQRNVSGKGIRYDFVVDVYGQRPNIEFFKDFDILGKGAVGWGSVTHQEMVEAATPVEYRIHSTSVDVVSALKSKKKKKRSAAK
jgi:hypothetical protein